MKLAVLGASGGTGRHLVAQARERGWEVVAITRPGSTGDLPPGVAHVTGDLTDAAFLAGAFAGCDAVAVALGLRIAGMAPWHRPADPTFLSRAGPAIAAAARSAGVQRIVAVSAGGVGDSRTAMPFFARWMIGATALRYVYPELEALEGALLGSGLDVCLCRPAMLTDGPRTGMPTPAPRMTGGMSISRADVAAWMLEQLTLDPFPHRATMIAPSAT